MCVKFLFAMFFGFCGSKLFPYLVRFLVMVWFHNDQFSGLGKYAKRVISGQQRRLYELLRILILKLPYNEKNLPPLITLTLKQFFLRTAK
jgi:hypothetical protein